MFPFAKLHREYLFSNEQEVFDKLNAFTYTKWWQPTDLEFVQADPPTFIMWFNGDMEHSAKPMATKVTVSLHRFSGGVRVKALAAANKRLYILYAAGILSVIGGLLKGTPMLGLVTFLVLTIFCFFWDRVAKIAAFKKLEKMLE